MKSISRGLILFLFLGLVFLSGTGFADEDTPEYQTAIEPGFQCESGNYARFETEEFQIGKGLDNILISTDIEKSPTATVRSYARFQYEGSGIWTRYLEFDGEFHYADVRSATAYQLLFIVRDDRRGTTRIKRFTVQGKKLGEDTMEFLLKKPAPFEASVAWPKPPIVSRADWNARPPKGSYNPQSVQRIVLHHSWSPAQAQYKGAATIRGIQNYHMDDPATGWSDIGYHFLIGPEGKIFQGRPENVVGAHCPPNTNSVGICVIGNYDPGADSNNPQIEASLINLLTWLSATYKVDPKAQYFGHRDFSSKSCPGDGVYDRMPFYRQAVLKNLGK